jgi:predicted Zn-dependent protease
MTLAFPRRRVIGGLFGALTAGGALAACSENPATGRRQLAFIPDEQLAQLGEAAWRDALSKMPRAESPALQARLARIGDAVVQASGRTGENWEFAVFDTPEINAFVLPGGKVGFYRGLMELAGDDGEIAAVMGHEVGHVEARHAAERMSQQMLVQLGVQAAAVVLSEEYGRNAEAIASALGMGVMYGVVLPYSRNHELEADAIGVRLMEAASYDPRDAVAFWERMVAANANRPRPLEWLSTHPADDRRLAALREAAAALQ